jgi:hypothetical protein
MVCCAMLCSMVCGMVCGMVCQFGAEYCSAWYGMVWYTTAACSSDSSFVNVCPCVPYAVYTI